MRSFIFAMIAGCGEPNRSVGRAELRAPSTIAEARDSGCYFEGELAIDAFDGVALDPLSVIVEYVSNPGDVTDVAFFDATEVTRGFFPTVALEDGGWIEGDADSFSLPPIAISPVHLSGRLFVDELGVALRRGVLIGETGRGVACLLLEATPDDTQ